MRTTLTIDDSINDALRELAADRKESFRDAVNEALQAGLTSLKREGQTIEPFKVEAHHGGFRSGIDLQKLNQLVDELDSEDFERESMV